MPLQLDATYRNQSTTSGTDHLGAIYLSVARALVATGFWRRKNQGDGQSAYSSGTGDLFTANSGLGYATSGAWNATVANSITHALAYAHLGEYVNGAFTGRELLLQRTTGTAAGDDLDAVMILSWEPFTGTPNANTAPTKPTKSRTYGNNDPNTAGDNVFIHLTTSPQMGGAGGTIIHNVWVCDTPGGTTEDVAPFWVEVYDSTADEPAFCFGYEALRDAAAGDDHPCLVCWPVTAGTTWEFGETVSAVPATHVAASGNACMFGVSSADNSTIEHMSMLRFLFPNSTTEPGNGAGTAADVSSQYPILPAIIYTDVADTSPSVFKGVCENLETLFPQSSHLWPNTMFASVAHATERARVSLGHVLLPWEVGVTRSGLSASDSTNLRRVLSSAPAADETDPELGTVSPAPGVIDPDEIISLAFSDETALAEVSVSATYSDLGYERTEAVYARGAYFAPYSGTDDGDATTLELAFSRDPGFPGDVVFTWVAVDGSGNRATGTVSYTLSSYLPRSTASP